MEASVIKKMKVLNDENRRLKQMFAALSPECHALKNVFKNFKTIDKAGARQLSDGTICHEHPPGVQDVIAEQQRCIFISSIPGVTNWCLWR